MLPTFPFNPPVDVSAFVRVCRLSPDLAIKNYKRIDFIQVVNLTSGLIVVGADEDTAQERYYQVSAERLNAFCQSSHDPRDALAREAFKNLILEILTQPPQVQLRYTYCGKTREEAINIVKQGLESRHGKLDKIFEWDLGYLGIPRGRVCVGVSFCENKQVSD